MVQLWHADSERKQMKKEEKKLQRIISCVLCKKNSATQKLIRIKSANE